MFTFTPEHFENWCSYAGEDFFDQNCNCVRISVIADHIAKNHRELEERFVELFNMHSEDSNRIWSRELEGRNIPRVSSIEDIIKVLQDAIKAKDPAYFYLDCHDISGSDDDYALFVVKGDKYTKESEYESFKLYCQFICEIINASEVLNKRFVGLLEIHPKFKEGNEDIHHYGIENGILYKHPI